MDRGIPTCTVAVFIDFRKAFDCVCHSIIIEKLHTSNLNQNAINWIISYLSNRQQQVMVNNSKLNFSKILQGVPQGSILGPLLYIT